MDFEEVTGFVQCDHRVMPYTTVVIDTLMAVGQKSVDIVWLWWFPGRCHNHDVALAVDRDESLTAQRMALHQS